MRGSQARVENGKDIADHSKCGIQGTLGGREKRLSARDPTADETNEKGKPLSRRGSAGRRRVGFRGPIKREDENRGGKDGIRSGSVVDSTRKGGNELLCEE